MAGVAMALFPLEQLFLSFLPWPFPAEPGIALAAEPEPHKKPCVSALRAPAASPSARPSLDPCQPRPASHAWHGNCPPEARS